MSAVDMNHLARAYQSEWGTAEFRRQAVKAVIAGLAVLVLAGLWAITIARPADPWPAWFVVGGLALTAGLGFGLLRWGALLAAGALSLGLLALLIALTYLVPAAAPAPYFCLVVLVAGSIDWRVGLVAAVVSTAGLVVIQLDASMLLDSASTHQALVLIWAALALIWLATRQMRAVADAAWSNYVLAWGKIEEVRRHQAELARLSKSLDHLCYRLEWHNRALAEARAAAEAARQLKAEFAATVGHELRTPVNLIVGFSELMIEADQGAPPGGAAPASFRHDLAVIHRNARHISQLVDDILDLSQVDAHRMALRRERLALGEVVNEAVTTVRSLGDQRGLSVTVHLPAHLPRIDADPVRIRQVVINLLYNAIHFTDRGGVTVSARHEDRQLVVAVADTGSGIPPAEIPRVFEEYRQLQPSARGSGGSGFGLAVCKRFIDLHGGRIWATSTLGAGSTFYFSLPVHDQAPAASGRTAPVQRAAAPGPRRVVVVDPMGDVGRILQRYLDGFEVSVIEDAGQLGRLDPWSQHAVLLPSSAAEQTWQRCCQARAELADVPVVVCPLRTQAALADTLGVAAYLTKPVSRQHLARALDRLGRRVRTIVVIDDDEAMCRLLAQMLTTLSRRYRVRQATTADAGLRWIRAAPPDVVLLDLLMPGIDGYGVLDALRRDAALRQVAVIVVTAKGLSEAVTAAHVRIARPHGLSIAETVACISASLNALAPPVADMAPGLRASSAG